MDLNKYIDHTILKSDAITPDIVKICAEARTYDFASVCVNPTWVNLAAKQLKGTNVKICTVIGFPLGASTTETKAFETSNAIKNGATEIDMVLNISALIEGENDFVKEDIKAVVKAADGICVKVIMESCLLTKEQIELASQLIMNAGADFVKTSTGFSTGGALVEDIKLIKSVVKDNCLIKASGGVRNLDDAKLMIEAGANRIGTSGGVEIVQGLENNKDY